MKAESSNSVDKALAIARSHPTLREVMGTRGQVLFVEPVAPRRGASAEAHVLVALHDYQNNRSFLAVIDQGRSAVVSVHESRARFQLAPDERETAERLAGEDGIVQAFLDGRSMQPLTRLYLPPARRADADHRWAIVFLRPTTRERAYAIVDLTAERVVEVVSREAFTGEQRGGGPHAHH